MRLAAPRAAGVRVGPLRRTGLARAARWASRVLPALLAMLALLLVAPGAWSAPPASLKASGFSINANDMRLRAVFEQFSQVYGLRLSMAVNGDRVMKTRLKADNGIDFLNRLAQTCQFRWFVYNDTLYVVPSDDNTSMRLEVGDDAVQDAKAALIGVGLYDDRFGWGELPDVGTVIVSGPRAYVKLAREILLPDTTQADPKAKRIMMFRLKYASATDRVINARGQQETIPGVKTILSNLLFGAQTGEKLGNTPPIDMESNKRSRKPKVEQGSAREVGGNGNGNAGAAFLPIFAAPSGAAGAGGNGGGGNGNFNGGGRAASASEGAGSHEESRPRIEANAALNAIMIYDTANKRSMYASLIAELDVQPQQIEIEALIVDMDRSKLTEMGVEWGVTAGSVNAVMNASGADSLGAALPISSSTLLISNAARFYARLKAMEQKGDARVLATPTVLTIDNVAAILDLSQTAYVSLVGERVADLADVTAGTMLRVIPRIINDGGQTRVHLEVDIEDGSIDSTGTSSGNTGGSTGNNNVNVTRSTISTQAIIDSQQTLMIGGYRAERLSVDKTKVPLLGDLPLVGGLFRSSTKSSSTRERLFLITPRLSGTGGTPATAMSASARRARAIATAQANAGMASAPELPEVPAAAPREAAPGRGNSMPLPPGAPLRSPAPVMAQAAGPAVAQAATPAAAPAARAQLARVQLASNQAANAQMVNAADTNNAAQAAAMSAAAAMPPPPTPAAAVPPKRLPLPLAPESPWALIPAAASSSSGGGSAGR